MNSVAVDNFFEAWCRDPRDLFFGEYLDGLYRAWDSARPPDRLGEDVHRLYDECHRLIRANQRFALAFLGIDRFEDLWRRDRRLALEALKGLRAALGVAVGPRPGTGVELAELGGANFLALFDPDHIAAVCEHALRLFDTRFATLRGSAPTVSIGVSTDLERTIVHFGQVFELAKEMREYGEKVTGSAYVVDRRTEPDIPGS